jgi:hypothetical protein
MSRPVDAIVLEYHLGLLDGAVVAAEIRKVKPELPIVMLADHLELPEGALKSVDALVTKSDGAHFLWATVHFVLNVKPALRLQAASTAQMPVRHRRPGNPLRGSYPGHGNLNQPALDERNAPFSPRVWRRILNGSVEF